MELGDPGADGGYQVAFRGVGVGKPVKTPTDSLDRLIRLKLPKSMVGYPQRLQLAWTKEVADASLVKDVLIEFDGHCCQSCRH